MRIALVVALVAQVSVASCSRGGPPVQNSHVDANVPSAATFTEFLQRDLSDHLTRDGAVPELEYSFLRDGPTQSGTAYPKYYLWVHAAWEDGQRVEGAARVAAINGERFEVTHFMTTDSIRAEPESIYRIFPKAVCARIEERL